jgi:hypothetical protein
MLVTASEFAIPPVAAAVVDAAVAEFTEAAVYVPLM